MIPGSLVWLYPIFFVSGAAALVFEALWFHQAGLAFGNSVWASALVLSSFMAGLGLGNGLAAFYGARIRSPILLYALLEGVVGTVGLALVFGLPVVAPLLSIALEPLMGSGWPLHGARFAGGFLLLLLPAVAMGATLPVLVKAMSPDGANFGGVLGRLYGTNTLGAVFGAVSAELLLIPSFGIRGSALIAAGLLACAALASFGLGRRRAAAPAPAELSSSPTLDARSVFLLGASFLSGATLLGLEMLWFRLLQLFMPPTMEVFALMLAVVLLGIGLGGLLGAVWLRFRNDATATAACVALLAGVVTIYCYAIFPELAQRTQLEPFDVLPLCAKLTFVTSLLSGVLFTLIGELLQQRLGSSVRSAGWLTFANTLGSMLGPLVAGFGLLPLLGLEWSLFLFCLGYAGVAVCILLGSGTGVGIARPWIHAGAAALFAWMAFQFPFGNTERMYQRVFEEFSEREKIVAVREESHQITAYLQRDFMGEPYYYRLMTNTYSMASSNLYSRRYMSLFSVLPMAFHSNPRDAVLISYGVGITAKSLTLQPQLERIDVVDISRGILELGQIVFPPEEHPLDDPRVHVHVEDGRHFLQTTRRRYDMITGEPPPPAAAGVVNLYTREYFELMRERLRDGGIATYWLPVSALTPVEAKAITRAFCDAFPDCSLWGAAKADWILVGTRGNTESLSEAQLRRPWSGDYPDLANALQAIGFERAEQLAALFLADADWLRDWVAEVPVLVDNWPYRGPRWTSQGPLDAEYLKMLDTGRARFEDSGWLAGSWPRAFRDQSLPYFEYERLAKNAPGQYGASPSALGVIHQILKQTNVETLPLWLLGSNADRQRITAMHAARGLHSDEVEYEQALGALAARDYAAAAELLGRVTPGAGHPKQVEFWLYALCMAGRIDEAEEMVQTLGLSGPKISMNYWTFMKVTFGLSAPKASSMNLPF